MNETAADKQTWVDRAEYYELLARTFSYAEGDDSLGRALSDGSYAEAAREVCASSGARGAADCVEALDAAYRARGAEELQHRVNAEYTRLFIGTVSAPIAPYGSWWKAVLEGKEPVLFLSKECQDVEAIMHKAGVGNRPGLKEPLDHIGCELEFLQYVCTVLAGLAPAVDGAEVTPEVYTDFVENHLRNWTPSFSDALLENTEEPLFVFAAKLLAVA